MSTPVQTASLPLPPRAKLCAVATRPDPGSSATGSVRKQTLLFTSAGCFELLGLEGGGEVRVGQEVPLTQRLADGRTQPFHCGHVYDAATDPADGCIYLALRTGVWRLDAINTVALAAGHATEAGDADAYNGQAPGGQLYLASHNAIYKLVGANLRLVAGAKGGPGHADGPGLEARFEYIDCVAIDATGSLYIACASPSPLIRKLSPDGTVSTLPMPDPHLDLQCPHLQILPGGWLLAFNWEESEGHVLLKLDIQPCGHSLDGDSRRLHQARLVQDLATLLDDCSSGAGSGSTSDVVVVAGGSRFPAHRAVLAARCEYFRSRIAGPDWDATAGELTLEDADPAAFRCLLRYIYTGDTAFPPDLMCPVAELAAMLLLREACGEAQRQVLRGVTPGRFVACLLLADGHAHTGMGFPELLQGLVGWYVENHGSVMEAAEAELEGLMASHPKLAMQLHRALGAARKRPRTDCPGENTS